MDEKESQKLGEEVKLDRRFKKNKIKLDVVSTVEETKSTAEPVKPVGEFNAAPAVPDKAMLKKFEFKPADPKYKGWVKLTPEEAEELGLAGKLLGHHPGLGIGLLIKDKE